jgi:hypothetical protein
MAFSFLVEGFWPFETPERNMPHCPTTPKQKEQHHMATLISSYREAV